MMKSQTFFLNIFVICLCAAINFTNAREDENLIVSTAKGDVKGIKELSMEGKDIYSFLGIPFAKPPVGLLRFKEPIEPDPWTGVLDSTNYPDECMQYSFTGYIIPEEPMGSEDCLYLNVFTRNPNEKSKPVMVYIHGGAFFSGKSKNFRPNYLLEEDIVLVTIQYRLGVFGFLSTDDEVMPGNYGLKDQTLALKWVQQNIANFGGDPNQVTIFGNSAGGASTHMHMLSPWSKGLFNKVIIQSGVANAYWSTSDHHRATAEEYGSFVGCPLEDDSHKYEKCMKEVDSQTLNKAALNFVKWVFAPLNFVPRIDKDFLPEAPLSIIQKKAYNKAEVMIGQTRDEGAHIIYLMSLKDEQYDNLRSKFEEYGPISLALQNEPHAKEIANRVYAKYLKGKAIDKENNEDLIILYNHSSMSYGIDMLILLLLGDADINVYPYELHHRGQYSFGDFFDVKGKENWVSHVDECFYLFQGGDKFSNTFKDPQDLMVKEIITKTWTNFAATGNPTPDDSLGFRWEKARPSNFTYFKITPSPTNELYERDQMLEFWLSLPIEQNKQLREIFGRKRIEL